MAFNSHKKNNHQRSRIFMDSHQSMKIIEICKVSPSSGESPAPKSLPLTFFDLLWLRFHPIQRLFFYEISSAEVSFVDDILPKLKTSLALALRSYLPLAASLVWPEDYDVPTVEYVEGDGVLLTVAESDTEFYDVSSNRFREVEEYHGLVPQLSVCYDRAAVIALQVTVFGDYKGFSIGITNHHAVVDGRTSTSFFKLWARLCSLHVVGSGLPIPTIHHLMPLYHRSVIDDSLGLASIYANIWLNEEGPNNRSLNLKLPKTSNNLFRCTLELSRQNLQSLKQWYLRQKEHHNSHISSFVLATAYFCVCTAKFEGLSDGKLEFSFAADARTRLKPPVPSNYFGNCLSGSGIFMERSDLLSENGIFVASEAISKAIKGLEKGALNGVERWCSYMVAFCDKYEEVKTISIAGSPRFEVYSADFGWGKPRKVEVVSAESPLTISLTDSKNGDGGLEIGLVKEKHEIQKFAAIFSEGLECL